MRNYVDIKELINEKLDNQMIEKINLRFDTRIKKRGGDFKHTYTGTIRVEIYDPNWNIIYNETHKIGDLLGRKIN